MAQIAFPGQDGVGSASRQKNLKIITISFKSQRELFWQFSKENAQEEGYSQKNEVWVCSLLPKTLTLFMTKICDFPYPIYDLTKNVIPYL